ncbi:hypothetical protein SDC9_181875 [bioreactor metagenome]|uniref:Uncharacterized protein n=1 Tax=bioreactor metagenome TaxID=1076179 RepID=A0A645H7P6_9ZZZZ
MVGAGENVRKGEYSYLIGSGCQGGGVDAGEVQGADLDLVDGLVLVAQLSIKIDIDQNGPVCLLLHQFGEHEHTL